MKETTTAKELRIKLVSIRDVTTRDNKKFKAYKVLDKTGKLMDCKFRQEITNVPTEPCIMVIEKEKCNVATNRQYPVLWVQEIKAIEELSKESNAGAFFD